ncbi:MAG: integrase core domain-containing protein [Pseudomonadota bacterium]
MVHDRLSNGPEFVAEPLQAWLKRVGIEPIRIPPGSPWETGYNDDAPRPLLRNVKGTLRRELLDAEWFATTRQAQTVIDIWLRQHNRIRPHEALGMRPPIPETV